MANDKNYKFFCRGTDGVSSLETYCSMFEFAGARGCGRLRRRVATENSRRRPLAAEQRRPTRPTPRGKSSATPQAKRDLDHPVVEIETSKGKITVGLDRQNAVNTVDNFLSYVGRLLPHKTIIPQVFKGEVILAGGYDTKMVAKPARTPSATSRRQRAEERPRHHRHVARRPDSVNGATSQFFINVAENRELDYKDHTDAGYGYCVFGKVTQGMEVVDAIDAAEVLDTKTLLSTPAQQIVVISIRRIR